MKTETRIFRCDGCAFGEELNESGRDDPMPREWYALSHRALHFGRPLDEPNPLHFCSASCLLSWCAGLCGVSLPNVSGEFCFCRFGKNINSTALLAAFLLFDYLNS